MDLSLPASFQYGVIALVAVLCLTHLARTLQTLGPGIKRRLRPRALGRPRSIPCPDLLDENPELKRHVEQKQKEETTRRRRVSKPVTFNWERRRMLQRLIIMLLLGACLCAALLFIQTLPDIVLELDRRLRDSVAWPPGPVPAWVLLFTPVVLIALTWWPLVRRPKPLAALEILGVGLSLLGFLAAGAIAQQLAGVQAVTEQAAASHLSAAGLSQLGWGLAILTAFGALAATALEGLIAHRAAKRQEIERRETDVET